MTNRILGFCVGVIFTISIILVARSTAQNNPRTYYESLDLSSPEAALNTMLDAFQRNDYFTVYLVLHKDAQQEFRLRMATFGFDRLVQAGQVDAVLDDAPLFRGGVENAEHNADGIFMFDEFMLAASMHDAFLIDLRNPVTIDQSQNVLLPDGSPAVDIVARLDNRSFPIIFRMIQSPSGRWRVFSVRAQGAAEDEPLWSLQFDAPEITFETAARWETVCDDTPPQQPDFNDATLTVSPDCGNPRAEIFVTVTGTGFTPFDEVQLWIRPSASDEFRVQSVTIIRPDENGNFSVAFAMPAINLTADDDSVVEIVARQFVGQE